MKLLLIYNSFLFSKGYSSSLRDLSRATLRELLNRMGGESYTYASILAVTHVLPYLLMYEGYYHLLILKD